MTDIIVKQGTDSGIAWPIRTKLDTPFDLTGFTVRAQVRSIQTGELLHTWSTGNDNAVVSNGMIYLLWDSAETAAWRWRTGRYDLEIISEDGGVTRIDSGVVNINKEITR